MEVKEIIMELTFTESDKDTCEVSEWPPRRWRNYLKVSLIILILALAIIFSKFPYFNLILKPKVIVFFCLVLIVALFPVKTEQLIKICLGFLILALIFTLVGAEQAQQLIGELIYCLLFLGLMKKMIIFLHR